MKIVYRDVANTGGLAHVYNEQVASVPHCYPVSTEEFETGLRDSKNDRHCKELHSAKIIVGEKDGKIIGFAHLKKVKAGPVK